MNSGCRRGGASNVVTKAAGEADGPQQGLAVAERLVGTWGPTEAVGAQRTAFHRMPLGAPEPPGSPQQSPKSVQSPTPACDAFGKCRGSICPSPGSAGLPLHEGEALLPPGAQPPAASDRTGGGLHGGQGRIPDGGVRAGGCGDGRARCCSTHQCPPRPPPPSLHPPCCTARPSDLRTVCPPPCLRPNAHHRLRGRRD